MRTDSAIIIIARQKRLHVALQELPSKRASGEHITYRELAEKHNVCLASLRRVARIVNTPNAALEDSSGRGRKRRLTKDEEKILKQRRLSRNQRGNESRSALQKKDAELAKSRICPRE